MCLTQEPRNVRGAAGCSDDVSGVHDDSMSAVPTLRQAPIAGPADTFIPETGQSAEMAHGPRKSRLKKSRGAFGQRLRDLRLARGLTQEELGAEIGTSRSHIAGMETAADPPGRETLHALATFFAVSMDFLQAGITQAPQDGRFVHDPEQLAWLDLWAAIHPSDRPRILRMLRAAAFDQPG
jgi:transcriptional regulator with XRE-family HTH domain